MRLRELLDFSFVLHKMKLFSAAPIILVSPIRGVFVKAEVYSWVSPPLEGNTQGWGPVDRGFGEGSLALTVVELAGLSHHGHRDSAAIGLVEEAVVGAQLWEGCLPMAIEV